MEGQKLVANLPAGTDRQGRHHDFWGVDRPFLEATLSQVKPFTAIVERCPDTGFYVPGFPGAHSQAESLDELKRNLQEVVQMLLQDEHPRILGEFVGTQMINVG